MVQYFAYAEVFQTSGSHSVVNGTSYTSTTWELDRNGILIQICWIRNWGGEAQSVLTSPPGDAEAQWSLKATVLEVRVSGNKSHLCFSKFFGTNYWVAHGSLCSELQKGHLRISPFDLCLPTMQGQDVRAFPKAGGRLTSSANSQPTYKKVSVSSGKKNQSLFPKGVAFRDHHNTSNL